MEETTTPNCPATQDFEARVREHQAGVRAFIRALGADEAWVDDLAQEVFIVAHRRLNQFEPGTDFGKWLRSIARYLVANERRKEARHSRLLPFAVVDALLAHEPDFADEASLTPVDLQLSGHSHGGQVWLPGIGAPWLPPLGRRFPRGLYKVGNLTLYTNIGIGTIRAPIRINCPPEITLITLRSKKL